MRKDFLLAPLVLLLGMTISTVVFAQVAFNKRATGSIGVAPQPGNLLNDASLDNIDFQNGTLRVWCGINFSAFYAKHLFKKYLSVKISVCQNARSC